MPFEWKKAEQEQSARDHQALLIVGIATASVGIIGTVLRLAFGHQEDVSYGLITTALGVVIVVGWLVTRNRRRGARATRRDRLDER